MPSVPPESRTSICPCNTSAARCSGGCGGGATGRSLPNASTRSALREPWAAWSNFIVGYPGETEDDHDALLCFVEETRLDWCGFFSYSAEEGTYALDLDGQVAPGLVADRLAELTELQDRITAERQDGRIGSTELVLVEAPGVARSVREAPGINAIIWVPHDLEVGVFHKVEIVDAAGPDLNGRPS